MNVAALRAQTPSCEELIHFNNAGAALTPDPVHAAVSSHLELERRIGGYEAAAAAADQIDNFYQATAKLINAKPTEIAAVENATRAWDMAFYSIPWQWGDRIITHESEYASNYLAFLQLRQRFGVEIDLAPSDPAGQIDISALPGLVKSGTKLIALTHVPSQSGLINPVAEVGKFAKEHGLLFLLDACQSLGQLSVNAAQIGCDFLSGTGRKFLRGPRGTGLLYVNEQILDQLTPIFIDLHAARWVSEDQFEWTHGARRFENWECYVAGKIGLGAAIDYALAVGLENIETRVGALAETLRERLHKVPGVSLHDRGRRLAGIVTFTHEKVPAGQLADRLRATKINTSVTPATYAQLDLGPRGLAEVNRASVHYYNTESEIERFCQALQDI